MTQAKRPAINWMDGLWLLFLVGLALLPPLREVHKQLILLAFGVLQLAESWLIAHLRRRGMVYVVLVKIALATLLIDHTGEISINSSYWPIYFLPAVTAAEYFGPLATLLWTTLASAAYCSYLYQASFEFELTEEAYGLLAIRILFFFLAHGGEPLRGREPEGRPSVIRNWPRPWLRPTAVWSRRRLKPAAPSVSPLWASFPPDWRTRFATRWA